MEKALLALVTVLALSGIYLGLDSQVSNFVLDSDREVFQAYQIWKQEFNMNFNDEDEQYRFENFKFNHNFINEHNALGDQLVLKMNQFGGMTQEEIEAKHLLRPKAEIEDLSQETPAAQNIDIDWVKRGAVLPTTNQANCGACWAFSSIASLQGLRFLTDGVLERLSAQQLVSCIPASALDEGATDGCGGSEPKYAFQYTHVNGIETWENYPYVSGTKPVYVPPCHHKNEDSVFYNKGDKQNTQGWVRLENDVNEMKVRVQQQVLSPAVAASSIYFSFYHKGTILNNRKCGTALNHNIAIVGLYDVEGEQPYWRVQNSWGPTWGDNGYGKIAVTSGKGICGINMNVDIPTAVDQNTQQQQINF